MKKRDDIERTGASSPLGNYLTQEKQRIFNNASPARREQMEAACRAREVYQAWNTVCARTREGQHVTGLHYVPTTNELVVYMDGASWTTEMTLLREIIRARMAAAGVEVSALIFKTSREGYTSASQGCSSVKSAAVRANKQKQKHIPHKPLNTAESARIEKEVSSIEDTRLRQALKNAMEASLSWRKSQNNLK